FGSAALSPSIIGSARGAPTQPRAGRGTLLESFHHAANLARLPNPAASRGWNAAPIELPCDTVPRRYPATPQLRDDRSQFRCPRVGTRNKGFTAGLAGLGLPSDCHGFQRKGYRVCRARWHDNSATPLTVPGMLPSR